MCDQLKLIQALKCNSFIKEGTLSIGLDGVKYRYDSLIFADSVSNYLVKLFDKIAGTKSLIQINEYSIRYERPNFKGQINGTFRVKYLVEL